MNAPMTHEKRLVRVEGVEPHTNRFQLPVTDPTPMSTNETSTQRLAETKPNDRKWLDGSHITEQIAAHIRRRASQTKSWFKAHHIATAIDENPRQVGPAMAAMYRSGQFPEIVERRSAGDTWVYRVEVNG